MKKLLFVFALSTLLFAYGCGKKTTNVDTTMSGEDTVVSGTVDNTVDNTADEVNPADTTNGMSGETTGTTVGDDIKGKYVFEDANCQKYVALMECLVDKTPEEGKASTVSAFTKVMDLWKSLDVDQLPNVCKQAIDALSSQSEVFANAGCPLDSLSN